MSPKPDGAPGHETLHVELAEKARPGVVHRVLLEAAWA